MSRHTVLEVKTLSSHGSYHGWPTVARLAGGEFLHVGWSSAHVIVFVLVSNTDHPDWAGLAGLSSLD